MCLAVPAKIIAKQDVLATVDIDGITRDVSLMLLPAAAIGEYVLVHAGFAMQIVDKAEADAALALLKELTVSD